MTSKAEQIVSAIETALTVPAMSSVPASRVFRDLSDALRSESFPAVVLETGDERSPQAVMIGFKHREVDVMVTVLADGVSPFTQADAAVVECFDRIFADRTIGGLALDVTEGETMRDRDGMGERVGAVRKRYAIAYRTTESSLES